MSQKRKLLNPLVLTRCAGIGWHELLLTRVPDQYRRAFTGYFSRQVFVIVARHEQQHTTVWILHCYRPQGHPIAPADDRRHDGAQLRTEHHALLPEAGHLLCSAFWQVTGALRSGGDPQLSDLPRVSARNGVGGSVMPDQSCEVLSDQDVGPVKHGPT